MPLSRLKGKLGEAVRTVTGEGRPRTVVVVSGLPRSGTSMMMRMLEAGGIPPLTDGEREANVDNPKGYYEFERVKKLDKGDTGWLPEAHGKAVKVISALLKHLPDDHTYKVLFMRRKLPEVLASQKKMLVRRGKDPDEASDEELTALFEKHLEHIEAWARAKPNVELLHVWYNEVLEAPEGPVDEVVRFLDRALDRDAMLAVVDPSLYRNRAPE